MDVVEVEDTFGNPLGSEEYEGVSNTITQLCLLGYVFLEFTIGQTGSNMFC